jgi:predicted permease
MLDVLVLILPIFLPILAGAAVVRSGLLPRSGSRVLSLFFLYLAVPSLLVHQLAKQHLAALYDPRYMLAFLLLSLGLYGGVFLVDRVLLKRAVKVSALAAFAGSKFNAVILALPILHGTLGEAASGPFIINVILGYFTTLPLTVALLGTAADDGRAGGTKAAVAAFAGVLKDPLVLGALVGVLLAATGVVLPAWLDQTLGSLGAAAVPTALVATGMAISLAEIRQHFGEVLRISVVRVLISPALAIAVAIGLGLSPTFSIALVLSFGIATAQLIVPLSEKAGVYRTEAAAVVAATTVSMVITLPLLIWICSRIWPGPILGDL